MIRLTGIGQGAHHVTFAGKDKRQLSTYIISDNAMLLDVSTIEMDQETFHKMWHMSGEEATQHLFLRLNQEEYYVENRVDESVLKFYPSVRPRLTWLHR
jgi:hypothetical protein